MFFSKNGVRDDSWIINGSIISKQRRAYDLASKTIDKTLQEKKDAIQDQNISILVHSLWFPIYLHHQNSALNEGQRRLIKHYNLHMQEIKDVHSLSKFFEYLQYDIDTAQLDFMLADLALIAVNLLSFLSKENHLETEEKEKIIGNLSLAMKAIEQRQIAQQAMLLSKIKLLWEDSYKLFQKNHHVKSRILSVIRHRMNRIWDLAKLPGWLKFLGDIIEPRQLDFYLVEIKDFTHKLQYLCSNISEVFNHQLSQAISIGMENIVRKCDNIQNIQKIASRNEKFFKAVHAGCVAKIRIMKDRALRLHQISKEAGLVTLYRYVSKNIIISNLDVLRELCDDLIRKYHSNDFIFIRSEIVALIDFIARVINEILLFSEKDLSRINNILFDFLKIHSVEIPYEILYELYYTNISAVGNYLKSLKDEINQITFSDIGLAIFLMDKIAASKIISDDSKYMLQQKFISLLNKYCEYLQAHDQKPLTIWLEVLKDYSEKADCKTSESTSDSSKESSPREESVTDKLEGLTVRL